MLYGYKGKLLHIDLTREVSQSIPVPEEIPLKYIGGRGLGAKLFWDLMSPEAEPLQPENIFMVLTGPLNGTMAPCTGKHLIVTKSPATGGWLEAYSSGLMAANMKFAGYDGLLITGKAERPVYVVIEDDKVDIRDAGHLWGKGTFETEKYAKETFHPDCGAICIGPAGENLVKFACVSSEYFRKAGRGGAGAVMGSKNLKLLAIRGSGSISCADLQSLYDLIVKHRERYKKSTIGSARRRYGTPLTLNITNEIGMLPTHNFSQGQFNRAIGKIDKDGVAAATVGARACYACFLSCSKRTKVQEGVFRGLEIDGPEYETLAMLGSNLEIDYLPAIIRANYLCDDLGLDTISAGAVSGFVMECFERGILTEQDTGGLNLKFGNYEAVLQLLEQMAIKKGFGEFCSRGVKAMAQSLGAGSEDFAMQVKGLEFPGYDPRAAWGAAITYAVTPRGGCHRRAWPASKALLEDGSPYKIEGKAEIVRELMNENCVMHSLIVCDFPGKFIPLSVGDFAEYLNVVTGLNYTGQDLIERAEMIETLIRRVNIREGMTAEDDSLPKRILEESHPEGPTKGKIIGLDNFLRMRLEYYALRGWDDEGVPTQTTMDRYGFNEELKIVL